MSTPAIATFEAEDPTALALQALRKDGVAIIKDVLADEAVDQLNAILEPHFDAPQTGGSGFISSKTTSIGGIFGIDAAFSEHLMLNRHYLELNDAILLPKKPMADSSPKPVLQSLLDRELVDPGDGCLQLPHEGDWDPEKGPNCDHYRVNAAVSIRVHPGAADQPLHRDLTLWEPYVPNEPATLQYETVCHFALTEFTADNGATRFVPGSHLWAKERLATKDEVAQAVMPRGSVVVWLGRTLHGYGGNRTDVPRHGVLMSFHVDWLTQEENQFLTVPPEFASTLPLKAIQLLGYRTGKSNFVKGRRGENLLEAGRSGPL